MTKTTGQLIDELSKCMPPAQPDITNPHDLARYLTKREEFAKAAMQGILANNDWMNTLHKNLDDNALPFVATLAVHMADKLIISLNSIKP